MLAGESASDGGAGCSSLVRLQSLYPFRPTCINRLSLANRPRWFGYETFIQERPQTMKKLLTNRLFAVATSKFALIASASFCIAAEPTMLDVLKSCPKTANAFVQGDLVALRKLTLGSPLQADLPSNVTRVRIAAELDLEALQPDWEIGYAALDKMPTAEVLAQREAGYVDTLGNRSIVWTPNERYLIPLADNVLSIVRPADRKFVGQWLKKDRSNVISPYLQQWAATELANFSTLISVDLEDVVSAEVLIEKLPRAKSLSGRNIQAVAKSISELKGMTIEVAKDALNATVSIEFKSPATELQPVAKDFFAEVLAVRGISLAEYSSWKVQPTNEGKTFVFTGPISAQTLDDLLGMFTLHRGSSSVEAANTPTSSPSTSAPTSESVIAENTKNYFKKVVNTVHRVRDYSANNTGERAQWNGNMANRLDELPTLDVDPQMVMFGAEVAKALRNNMMSMQLVNIAQGAAAVASDAGTSGFSTATAGGTYAGSGGGYGGYGSYGSYGGNFVDPNSPVKYYQLGQARGNSSFKELMAQLEQSIADMRRVMTDKYKIQF